MSEDVNDPASRAITFDELPQAVSNILDGIAEIKSICEDIMQRKFNEHGGGT